MKLKTVGLNVLEIEMLKRNIGRDKFVVGAFTERAEAEGLKKDLDIIKEVRGIFFVIGELRG